MASPGSADKWREHAPQLALFRRANASRAGKLACCVICQSGGNGDIPSRHHDAVPNRLKDLFEFVVCPFISRAFQRNPHFQAVPSMLSSRGILSPSLLALFYDFAQIRNRPYLNRSQSIFKARLL